ncbi:MAG: hypothetical protein PHS60_09155, partial [Zavarzinia sp.]|nr:hypothetical protein [Zavarzinia sp.]
MARVLFALGLSGNAGPAVRWSAPLKAAVLAVSALAFSGCLVSSKNLGDDFGTSTPMPAGTYLDLVANKTEQVTLSNGGYTRADGTRIKLFGIQGTDTYIVQQAPNTVGGDMTYAFGRVSGDTPVDRKSVG